MSTFSCPIVRIGEFTKHKNADTLCVTQVEGSTCIFKEGAFDTGDLAVFIPLDAVVPLNNPTFAWLGDPKHPERTSYRVKAKRLRGVFSDGFLVSIADLMPVGTFDDGFTVELGKDVSARLGIVKSEEPEPVYMNTGNEKDPGFMPVYTVESWRKYKHLLVPEETVVVTEKIHGCNARFSYRDGRFWVGSHRTVKAQDERNMWWRVAREQDLENKLALMGSRFVLYGEVYGQVQDLKYSAGKDELRFAAFDIYDTKDQRFVDYDDCRLLCSLHDIPMAPELYIGPYRPDILESLVNPPEGSPALRSAAGDCIREGVVIKPLLERWNEETRRTVLKYVSEAYLLRSHGTEHH